VVLANILACRYVSLTTCGAMGYCVEHVLPVHSVEGRVCERGQPMLVSVSATFALYG
jgi:hypothetical protein